MGREKKYETQQAAEMIQLLRDDSIIN